jgi:hypothetical protein
MKMRKILVIVSFILLTSIAFSQEVDQSSAQIEKQENSLNHSIGSSLFVSFNYIVEDPADFYQLSYGYQLSPQDNIFVEAITWTYYEPLGTYENSEEMYPGKVIAYGIGAGYQRFLWKNAFTSVVATPFLQQFYDSEDKKIQTGLQLYLQFILGYRIELFDARWYVEPAYAFKYWPVNTNFPSSFEDIEDGAPNYKFEPSLNFGYRL